MNKWRLLNNTWNHLLFIFLGAIHSLHVIEAFPNMPSIYGALLILTIIYILLATYGILWLANAKTDPTSITYAYFSLQILIALVSQWIITSSFNGGTDPILAWGVMLQAAILSLPGRVVVWGITITFVQLINGRFGFSVVYAVDEIFLMAVFGILGIVLCNLYRLHHRLESSMTTLTNLSQQEQERTQKLRTIQQQFFSSATHDLKNPLFRISGYAQLLENLNTNLADEKAQDYIHKIQRSVHKMESLLLDILEISQLEDKPTLTLTHIDANQLATDSVEDFSELADKKNIHVSLKTTTQRIYILGDHRKLQRAVDNVLSNAIKYTPKNGHVWVSVHQADNQVLLTVQDSGPGLSEESLPLIFDSFYRADDVIQSDIEGTGLGLTIVKTIVEQHGGTVSADNVPEGGSIFIITLPALAFSKRNTNTTQQTQKPG